MTIKQFAQGVLTALALPDLIKKDELEQEFKRKYGIK